LKIASYIAPRGSENKPGRLGRIHAAEINLRGGFLEVLDVSGPGMAFLAIIIYVLYDGVRAA
jgi:hypothetical protein